MSEDRMDSLVESNENEESLSHQLTQVYKDFFKPRYQMRTLKNKGAILILVWNYALWTVFNHSTTTTVSNAYLTESVIVVTQAIGAALTMPLAGWLADVRFGRYKVITWSIWTMWACSVLITLGAVVADLVEPHRDINSKVSIAFLIVMGVGFCGAQANLIQFGVDQLHDASTAEITSFIAWYAGSFVSGRFILDYISTCVHKYSSTLGPIVINFHLTIIVVTHSLFKNWLIQEPVTQNPVKLVYNVIKYAIKNKYPRQRSAFTYCEDVVPSRIDFGKHKYGGPFTTEQVEDVKTLFRTLVFGIAITAFYGITYVEDTFISRSKNALSQLKSTDETIGSCSSHYMQYNGTYFISVVILIAVNEFFVYPVFHRCLPYFKILWKLIAGQVLRVAKYVVLIALTTYARFNYKITEITTATPLHPNSTAQCLFQASVGSLGSAIDGRWYIIPQILSSLSDLLIVISIIEYFCAQVPYSMKGLMAGIIYALLGQFVALNELFLLPFTLIKSWSGGIISCGFWYLSTKTAILLVIILIMIFGGRCRWRKREDVLPNEHIFAERYYTKIINNHNE